MKLSDQVCNIELAKRLKELGVEQDSHFYWYTDGINTRVDTKTDYVRGVYGYGSKNDAMYSAFTVAELGTMLPKGAYSIAHSQYFAGAMCSHERILQEANNEANARAKMIIFLLEKDRNPNEDGKTK